MTATGLTCSGLTVRYRGDPCYCGRIFSRERRTRSASCDIRSPLLQQFAQQRAMAARFVLAVTAHRQVGVVRQRRQKIQVPARIRHFHFCQETAPEHLPRCVVVRISTFQQRFTGRKVGKPNVIEVATRAFVLRHTAWRTANGADAQALRFCSRSTKPDDTNTQI